MSTAMSATSTATSAATTATGATSAMSTAAPAAPAAESVFVRIPAAAARHGAINLAQGVFDHGPAPALLDALGSLGGGPEHQYSPSSGHPALRAALAAHTTRWAGVACDPDTEVTVTAGATEALYCTLFALLGPGDEAILVEPAYESYAPVVAATGATVRRVRPPGPRAGIEPALLAAAVTPATRVIVVNSPWNPLGRSFDPAEWQAVADLAARHGLTVVSDETYEHLTLDGTPHPGVLSLVEDPERRVKVSSISKTLAATGWRVGWAVAGPELTRRIRAVHQFLTFCPATPLQLAAAHVLDSPGFPELVAARSAELARVVGDFCRRLTAAGLPAPVPESGFYVVCDVGEDAEAWCERAITEGGVAALPLTAFYAGPGGDARTRVRFALCKREDTLREAAARLERHLARTGRRPAN
ncbi:pyridoxal phosphate-dependent aminotransferase [Actinacidiphila epipremni]|uniref:Aminotransferase n=1 Tax=Actinacidiphila epipremni TaxID=2053013 RepID=A0ABX0ZIL4_9ACTN|nr:pyridoxal phosphate-dependent aminotransferase [Actinacidiphila epipremni]NJP42900.1 pyridoxal phosphate-dependent aminotransferase [Actinacidiphila epipremni]